MSENDPLAAVETTWAGTSIGEDASLTDAIQNAWESAKRGGAPQTLRVVDIYVAGSNPISEYKVIVGGA